MDVTEYLAFVPLLIYGMGLTNLLMEWKRFFDPNEIYLPYTLLTLLLTETAIYNVFIYQRLIDRFAGQNYLNYLLLLIPPFLFYLVTNVFTPEPGVKTRDYFLKRMPLSFTLMALLVSCNFFFRLEESLIPSIARLVFVVVIILAGFTRKIWLTYVLIIIWLVSLIFRGKVISGL
jgi:hypothetical protein